MMRLPGHLAPPPRRTPAHDLARSRLLLLEQDVDLIMEAVRTLPKDREVTVVDLGAGSGTTALSVFCCRGSRVRIVTVDHSEVSLDSTADCMSNAGYHDMWLGILSPTAEAVGLFREIVGGEIDMLLVDADHSYEGVSGDLKTWLPLVRVGAPVWAHDYTKEYPGSILAINEAMAAGVVEVVKVAGWGWLGRRTEVAA